MDTGLLSILITIAQTILGLPEIVALVPAGISLFVGKKIVHDKRLVSRIKESEGYSSKAYRCSEGKLTIGYGRNLEGKGISNKEANRLLSNDLQEIKTSLVRIGWYKKLNVARKDVIIEMTYQLGLSGVSKFRMMIESIIAGNFTLAAEEMLDSKWARQTPLRAKRLSLQMKRGLYIK